MESCLKGNHTTPAYFCIYIYLTILEQKKALMETAQFSERKFTCQHCRFKAVYKQVTDKRKINYIISF